MKSPFKFLDSYTKDDRDIFFGRDQEITELYRRVFESKMLLVYGISGTGKSSLVNCGLASRFDESDWLPVNVRRGYNINDSLNDAFNKQALTTLKKDQSTGEKLQSIYLDHFKPVYLLFDQFEELFIFGSQEEKSGFISIVKEITESEVQCRIIFIIREEFLAGMTEFESELPDIFTNRFRVEKMKRTNAISAVEGPCKVFGIETEQGFSEELIDKLCPVGNEIELTYLQIYLDRIFRLAVTEHPRPRTEDPGPSNIKFTNELLTKAGSVSDLLGQFLDEQIREFEDPETGMSILKSFVSVQGTTRQMIEDQIRDSIQTFGTDISEQDIAKYLTKFVDLRILKERDEAGHYELRHDALAEKIYEKFTALEKDIIDVKQFITNAWHNWQKRHVLLSAEDLDYITPYKNRLYLPEELLELIEKSKNQLIRIKRRRKNIAVATLSALLVVFAGFTLWALKAKEIAQNELYRNIKNSLTISLEKDTVLYVGIENPLSITVSGIPNTNLIVSVSGNSEIKGKDGKYSIKPVFGEGANVFAPLQIDSMGNTLTIQITIDEAVTCRIFVCAKFKNNKIDTIGYKDFKLKEVPDPIAEFAGHHGGKIQIKDIFYYVPISGMPFVYISGDNYIWSDFKVIGFKVIINQKGKEESKWSKSNIITSEQKVLIEKLRIGDFLVIDSITAIGPDNRLRHLETLVYQIY